MNMLLWYGALAMLCATVSSDDPASDCSTTGCLNGLCVPGSSTGAAPTPSKCICNPGFIKNPLDENVCSDIDECKLANGRICGAGKCINSPPGSYRCQCHPTMSVPYGPQYCLYRPQNNGINMQNIMYWKMVDEMFF